MAKADQAIELAELLVKHAGISHKPGTLLRFLTKSEQQALDRARLKT